MPVHPRSARLVLACRLAAAGWALLGVFLAGFAALAAGPGPAGATPARAVMVLLPPRVIVIVAELGIAWTLRSPARGGWVRLRTSGRFHPAARRWLLGGTCAPIVVDVLRRRRLTCMCCGQACRVGDPASPAPPG